MSMSVYSMTKWQGSRNLPGCEMFKCQTQAEGV